MGLWVSQDLTAAELAADLLSSTPRLKWRTWLEGEPG